MKAKFERINEPINNITHAEIFSADKASHNAFTKLMNMFIDLFKSNNIQPIVEAEKPNEEEAKAKIEAQARLEAIQQKIQAHIDCGNMDLVFQAAKAGYVFTQKQQEKLSEIFVDNVEKWELQKISDMIEKGYSPTHTDFCTLFFSENFQENRANMMWLYNSNKKANNSPAIIPQFIADYLNDADNLKQVWRSWQYIVSNLNAEEDGPKTIDNLTNSGIMELVVFNTLKFPDSPFCSSEEYHKTIQDLEKLKTTRQEYKGVGKYNSGQFELKQYEGVYYSARIRVYQDKGDTNLQLINHIVSKMKAEASPFYADEYKELLNEVKSLNVANRVHSLVDKKLRSNEFSIHKLDKLYSDKVNMIEEVYSNLQLYAHQFSIEQKFELENLVEKRLPEVLHKYFSIDDEYRTILTNHEGKNAGQLLDDSLNSILSNIRQLQENINHDKLHSLNVSANYLQSKNKPNMS